MHKWSCAKELQWLLASTTAVLVRPFGRWPTLCALVPLGILAGSLGAKADCPPNYEMVQRANLDADYVRYGQEIARWRDNQFKYALDQFTSEYRTGSKPIYTRHEADRMQLRDRLISGDLQNSTHQQRQTAMRVIGTRFRTDIAALGQRLRQDYQAQLARTRAEVAEMRNALQGEYSRERQALRQTIADGCRAERTSMLRSIFLWAGNRTRGDDAPTETPPVYGNLGIRG